MSLLNRIKGVFLPRSTKGDTFRCTDCTGRFEEFHAECPECGSPSVERQEIESQQHA